MAVVKEMWMAARMNFDEDKYTPLGYSEIESEVVALCEETNDFVCLFNTEELGVNDPQPGYWPMQGQTKIP